AHGGPMLVVEAGRLLEPLAIDVEHEAAALLVEAERFPGNREELRAEAEHAAPCEHAVRDAAARHVEHHVLELAELLAARVLDHVAHERRAGHDERAGPGRTRAAPR